jgi:FdhD protein
MQSRRSVAIHGAEQEFDSGTAPDAPRATDRPEGIEPAPPLDADTPLASPVEAIRLGPNGRESARERVIREARYDLYLNGERLLGFACLPCDLEAYVIGFLANEGILECPYYVDLDIDEPAGKIDARGPFAPGQLRDFRRRRVLNPGCGGGESGGRPADPDRTARPDARFAIARNAVTAVMRRLQSESALHRLTGGTHIAALADEEGEVLFTAEDIGRHAAVDKVIGKAILAAADPSTLALFSSGRVASEIAWKAVRAGTPVLATRAAPTDLAVRIAREHEITLVGFIRGERMNVYSAPGRILD